MNAPMTNEQLIESRDAWTLLYYGQREQRDALRSRVLRACELHVPRTEEAEIWADGVGEGVHDELFPACPGGSNCEGHETTVQVCSECGYEHDGDTATFRVWPCPTVVALADPISPETDPGGAT